MSSNGFYGTPRVESFAFGNIPDTTITTAARFDHTLQVLDRLGASPLFGMVECFQGSPVPLVFSVQQSNDNGGSDAYAAINIRVGGASVASVTVVPGGRVVFALETQTKDWLKLVAPRTAAGRLHICGFNIRLMRSFEES